MFEVEYCCGELRSSQYKDQDSDCDCACDCDSDRRGLGIRKRPIGSEKKTRATLTIRQQCGDSLLKPSPPRFKCTKVSPLPSLPSRKSKSIGGAIGVFPQLSGKVIRTRAAETGPAVQRLPGFGSWTGGDCQLEQVWLSWVAGGSRLTLVLMLLSASID